MSCANRSGITAAAASSSISAATVASTTSFAVKKCFNPDCTELVSRKGWRLRSGEYAQLCDRCASAYEEGRFCESFHSDWSGWRSCNSCRKRVHCGCIVSFYCYILLDEGGIDCMACASARKNFYVTSNPPLPPPGFYEVPSSERLKDLSGKGWKHLVGSGPVPWRQAASLFNSSIAHPESHPRLIYDMDRLHLSEKLSFRSLEKEKIEYISQRLINGKLMLSARDLCENGIAGANNEEHSGLSLKTVNHSSSVGDDTSSPRIGVARLSSNSDSVTHLCTIPPTSLTKQFRGNLHNGVDSAVDGQVRGRPRADARGKSQLLPRYWPRFTDEDLQQISGDSHSAITPLFEKMLSASDAGRIGRLVLPKKCAEAYFPPISQPEGLPLKVQDAKGKEWIFQFRFWPNNNSRMYVLEGVTPCIQSLQLQAGDIVTFSRLEPEGKLIMGFRKASGASAVDQENDSSKARKSTSATGDAELVDPTPWSKVDKSGYIAKDVESKSPIKKRKSSILGLKNMHFRIDSDDRMELKLTWEEAQGLLRPPPDHVPSVVVIDGFEFEEYEDAPVIGKPTILTTDDTGLKIRWVECEECNKWRKIPADALLPSKWTCSGNSWDPERSSCSAAQELTADQLEDLLPSSNSVASSKKLKAVKPEVNSVESLEGLDSLANLAILGEGEEFSASSQVTTKHPRHRPGCCCIVCIQPPSGKGHKQTCTCNVCLAVKRRFKTLMMKREKKQSEKDTETSEKKPQEHLPEKLPDDEPLPSSNVENCTANMKVVVSGSADDDDIYRRRSSELPFKGQIDLNMHPERDEELSPGYVSGSVTRILQDATERQQKSSNIEGDYNDARNQMLDDAATGETVGIGFTFSGSNNIEAGDENPTASSMKSPVSAPGTEDN